MQAPPTFTPPPRPPDIEVEVRFLSTNDGGRSSPVCSGYRGQFFYDEHDWDALQEYPGQGWVMPGVTVSALYWFLTPEAHRGKLFPGKQFLLREGARVVARGVVTRVLGLAER